MKKAAVMALLAAASTSSIALSVTNAKTMTHAANHYDFDVPDTYSLHNVSPTTMDFESYEVESKSSHAKLGLYFGNNPGFPKLKWGGAPVTTSSPGKTVMDFPYSVQKRQLEGLMTFTGLRYKGIPMTPYSSVHYLATGVNGDDGRAFTAIVRSIRVARRAL